MRKRLYLIKGEEGIVFVHGCSKKQSKLQKNIKETIHYLICSLAAAGIMYGFFFVYFKSSTITYHLKEVESSRLR